MHTDVRQFALHTLNGELECIDKGCGGFSASRYGMLKHGFEPPAIEYGYELADRVGPEIIRLASETNAPVVIISAPYKYVHTASARIAHHFCDALTVMMVNADLEPPAIVPFHKSQPGSGAYAKASVSDRRKTLDSMELTIDAGRIRKAIVIAVDDVNVTSETMLNTASKLEPLGPLAIWYLHAADFNSGVTNDREEIESQLNESAPHRLNEVLGWVRSGDFVLNTRILREILESPRGFRYFVRQFPAPLLEQIWRSILGSGKDYTKKYSHQLSIVEAELRTRNTPIANLVGQRSTMPNI